MKTFTLLAILLISSLIFYPAIVWFIGTSGINLIGPIMILTLLSFVTAFITFLTISE